MVKLVFNKTGNFLLQLALSALNSAYLTDEFFSMERNHPISHIVVIELARYKSLRELVNYLIRLKLASPATSALLVATDEQIIPKLKCGTVHISTPVSTWKNTLARLKRDEGNIDSVVRECMSYMNHQRLSSKQRRVINCLGEGMNLDEIAEHLFLSVKTVYTYISLVSEKYGFSTSKKLHRYIINETAFRISNTPKLTLSLPLSGHIALSSRPQPDIALIET